MLSNQIFRGPGWSHPQAARLCQRLMLSREDTGGEHPLCVFPEGAGCPPWAWGSRGGEAGQNGQPRLWQHGLALGAGDAAGEDPGAELPWEQGAVLHCHPKPRPSESVFLLFQLKRKQERLPSPLLSARCSLPALRAAALKPLVVSSSQVAPDKDVRGQWRVLALLCIARKGSCSSQQWVQCEGTQETQSTQAPFPLWLCPGVPVC